MKWLIYLTLSFAYADLKFALHEAAVTITEVEAPASRIDATLMVSGIYRNGCFQWLGAEVTHVTTHLHEIRPKALVGGRMCTMALVHYRKPVPLGDLEPGEHILRIFNSDGTFFEKTLIME